ncbi:alpha/beta hydrolase [Mycobacterium tuberculosis]|nr:alpha/beta hydrolase [Mycobacterium tuberculosis]
MAVAIARPKLEGNIAVGEDRRIGFAEFGAPQGRAVFWLHGTPGARRQIPTEARVYAEHHNIRLIGVDRPGIGASTPHQYETILAFADDLRTIADTLGIDKMAVVGLSGGGPYTLACAAGLPDRVVAAKTPSPPITGQITTVCAPSPSRPPENAASHRVAAEHAAHH